MVPQDAACHRVNDIAARSMCLGMLGHVHDVLLSVVLRTHKMLGKRKSPYVGSTEQVTCVSMIFEKSLLEI